MRKITVLAALLLTLSCCFALSENCRAATSQNNLSGTSAKPSASPAVLTYTNKETGYCTVIEDDACLLSGEERSRLALEMRKITAYGNAAFKSLDYNEYSAPYFAQKYYHELFGSESGTLFLIDMDNREIYLFSDGAIYKTVTNAYALTITDNVYTYASKADYYSCASEAYKQIIALLSGRKIAQPMKYISNALLALIVAALINYFIAGLLSRTQKLSSRDVLKTASVKFTFCNPEKKKTNQTKVYSPQSSGSSGGSSHRSSGGSSRSGGGGHRSSGGGGGHRF